MARLIEDYLQFVNVELDLSNGDLTSIEDGEIVDKIPAAVDHYSQDRPLMKAMLTDGTGERKHSLPDDWRPGFSNILRIEYPYGREYPQYVRDNDFSVMLDVDSEGNVVHMLRFLGGLVPQEDEQFLTFYTAQHEVTETKTTIPDSDFQAVAYLLTHRICISLAGRLRRTKDSARSADIVDLRRTKADEYLTQAKSYYMLYKDLMGLPDRGPAPVSLVRDYDQIAPWGSNYYLTHRR